MTWTYQQSPGKIYHNGQYVDTGYSGALTNKNNPSRQQVKGLGPLPRGTYRITGYSSSKGPLTIILQQETGLSFGRSLFRIHGEKRPPAKPGYASEGCIILGPVTRNRIWLSGDRILEVVE
jgi:hypothetical protein